MPSLLETMLSKLVSTFLCFFDQELILSHKRHAYLYGHNERLYSQVEELKALDNKLSIIFHQARFFLLFLFEGYPAMLIHKFLY